MLAEQTEESGEPAPGHTPSFVGQEQGLDWVSMRSQLKVPDHGDRGQKAELV